MTIAVLAGLVTLFISLISTPLAKKLALRFEILASPNHRTVHHEATPKLGGLSICLGFLGGLVLFAAFTGSLVHFWGLLLGGSVVFAVGLFDDFRGLACYRKLIGQSLAAVIAVSFGFTIDTLYLTPESSIELGYWAFPLSVFWIVTLTNAINLLDGLDGLASGFSIIASFFMLALAMILGNTEIAVICFILMASSVGFLRYNFAPAKIFLGDNGSLFLGFMLACLSMKCLTVPLAGVNMPALWLLFLIPLADTTLAILRRISKGRHPFWADKQHIHHKLLQLGLSHRSAVLAIYLAASLLGAVSLIMFFVDGRQIVLLFAVTILALALILYQLGCFDFVNLRMPSLKTGKIQLNQKRNG